jgi:small subunit ribosomal protein S16
MAVTIRLRRIGRKKQPSYRVVVTDSERPRDGAYLEEVGFYNPRRHPAELRLDLGKVDRWVGQGAGMSGTVASLVRKARNGGDRSVALHQPAAPPEVAVAPEPKSSGRARKAEPAAAPAEVSSPAAVVAAEVPADAPSAEAEEVPRAEAGETPAV